MNKSKSELRSEMVQLLAEFKSAGGVVEVLPARRRKIKFGCGYKKSKGFKTSSVPRSTPRSVRFQ